MSVPKNQEVVKRRRVDPKEEGVKSRKVCSFQPIKRTPAPTPTTKVYKNIEISKNRLG